MVEIVAEHVSRLFRCADRLWSNYRHFAEVIDLPRQNQGMIDLYSFNANRNNSRADEVIANGITIAGGATVTVDGHIANRLRVGTTFIPISNTAATPIAGTFSNLADGSIVTIDGNHLRASYEGGYGNDLTLAVVP